MPELRRRGADMPRDFEDHCWADVVSADDLAVYSRYARETYVGKRPALLAIDLYNSVYQGGNRPVLEVTQEFPGSCGENAWNAIEDTKQLFALARSRGFPVIYTTGEDRGEARPRSIAVPKRRSNNRGENPGGIFEAFKPEFEDTVIYKQSASGFFLTPLIRHLTQYGVDTIIICGESTSGCVRASVLDACAYGFHVVVVEEATFDRSVHSHKINLFDMHHKYADVMHLDELAEHLEAFPEV